VGGWEPTVIELEPTTGGPGAKGRASAGTADPHAPSRVVTLLPMPPAMHGGPARYEVVVDGWRFEVEIESASRADLRERASRAGQRGLGGGRQVVRAQIPGRIVAVAVSVGEGVEAGQRLLSVEAMKMENAVIAPWAGTIARVGVVAGQTVELGDELVVIE
jgi:biotin carboxyl carrier protein